MLCTNVMLILTIAPLLKGHDVQNNEAQTPIPNNVIPLEKSNKKLSIFVQSSSNQDMKVKIDKLQSEVDEIKGTLVVMNHTMAELSNSQKDMLELLSKMSDMHRQATKAEETVKLNSEAPEMHSKNEGLLDEHFNCLKDCGNALDLPQDCSEVVRESNQKSGVHILKQDTRGLKPFGAFCQRQGGKFWTVIQRRQDGAVNFTRNWIDYKNGFGDLNGDYWLGLERIHAMTSKGKYELWIQMEAFDGEVSFARYDRFSVASENDGFQLKVEVFSGNAADKFYYNNNMKFSTLDVDNDSEQYKNCAKTHMSGWWFKYGTLSNLNGQLKNENNFDAIYWDKGNIKALKYVHMALHL